MKPRNAIKTDLFADEHHRQQIDALGDPLSEIDSHIDFAALAAEIDRIAPLCGSSRTALARPEQKPCSTGFRHSCSRKGLSRAVGRSSTHRSKKPSRVRARALLYGRIGWKYRVLRGALLQTQDGSRILPQIRSYASLR
jgi:hypothetical protein